MKHAAVPNPILKSRFSVRLAVSLGLTMLLVGPHALAAVADDNPGSMDSIWADQTNDTPQANKKAKGKAKQTKPEASPSKDDSYSKAIKPVKQSQAEENGTSAFAPMKPLADFSLSDFVRKSLWPGIGPFKTSSISARGNKYDLQDPNSNHLQLSVENNGVMQAQLKLVKEKASRGDILDVQMATDFLLESLGAKAKKIVDFNGQLRKNVETVLAKGANVNLSAGHYLVSVAHQDDDNYGAVYLVEVNSRDANANAIKEHTADNLTTVVHEEAPEPGKKETSEEPVKTQEKAEDKVPETAENKVPETAEDKVPETAENKVPEKAEDKPQIAEATPAFSHNGLKQDFTSALTSWQEIKKVAVRKRDAKVLSDILSGNALDKQTQAVNWLSTNHKYFNLSPESVAVESFAPIEEGKKYSVIAIIRETSKYVEESTGQVLKYTEDVYKVNYTLERMDNNWRIVDSTIISSKKTPIVPHQQTGSH
jgi:outer membrane biosynthesis protein TonB